MITLQQKIKLAVCHEKARDLCYLMKGDEVLTHKTFELSHLLHELIEELAPTATPETLMRLNELREKHNTRAEESAT